ncbi:MAG: type I methionyl aminopeptidase [Planctomycetes bacterium]|nr:type I methionyl aminopeptidase [Planctomycetota bacterium]
MAYLLHSAPRRSLPAEGPRVFGVLANKAPIYNEKQRNGLRAAGRFNAELMDYIRQFVVPGVTTGELDRLVYEYTIEHGHRPACLGYQGFPRTICTSVNDVVCHGIPDDTELTDGDIVNIDLTTVVHGWYGDSSETFLIGKVSDDVRRLVQVTFDAMFVGIRTLRPHGRVIDIGRAIVEFVRPYGYGVVEKYQGHGIGRQFHQEPGIPHFPHRSMARVPLRPGMCFTIEPMLNAGSHQTADADADGWTVRTKDGSLSAQFEHTVLMTEDGPEILTLTQHGPQEGHVF